MTAPKIISTRDMYHQVKSWLFQFNSKCGILREKLGDLTTWEEQVEAAYQECLYFATQAKERSKQALAVVQAALYTAVESAINETNFHVLDQNFVPVDSLSQLIWYQDPGYVSAYPLYSLQINCLKEHVDAMCQVALFFNLSGFDHLNIGPNVSALQVQVEQLHQQLSSLENGYRSEIGKLNNELEQRQKAFKALDNQLHAAAQQFSAKEAQFRRDLDAKDESILGINAELASWQQEAGEMNNNLYSALGDFAELKRKGVVVTRSLV